MSRTIPSTVATIAFVLALVSGCGSNDSDDTAGLLSLSQFEQEILSDRTVTADEYATARDRTLACLSDAGFQGEFLPQDERIHVLSIDSGAPAPGESDTDLEARFLADSDACKAEYLDDIEMVWVRETAPSEEEIEAAFTTLQSCLAPLGLDISSDDTDALVTLFHQVDAMTDAASQATANECLAAHALATTTGG